MSEPYYADDAVTLYHGDCREVLPSMPEALIANCVITDPPYGETSLEWDRWVPDWPQLLRYNVGQLWCFGSMRMFLDRRDDFAGWKFAQDVVWEKHNGSSLATDRFRRVHEHALHFYQGRWADLYHVTPTTPEARPRRMRRSAEPARWQGERGVSNYVTAEGGPLLMRSVIFARTMNGTASHPTEKPLAVLEPLIEFSCPPGSYVLDPFAGSGSTLVAAKARGRKAVGVEIDERYCEIAAKRLAQEVLDFGAAS